MADHLDEGLHSPAGDARIDITDIYAFHPPRADGQKLKRVVLAMGVNPLLIERTFRAGARYEFLVDTNGDAIEDLVFRLTFSKPRGNGQQRVRLRQPLRMKGVPRVRAKGRTEQIIHFDHGGRLFAGIRDDPFFFDLIAFLHDLSFGNPANGDFFAGKNVSAIVLELPRRFLGKSKNIGVWGRTLIPVEDDPDDDDDDDDEHGDDDDREADDDDDDEDETEAGTRGGAGGRSRDHGFIQVERMGRPAINTVFMPKTLKQQFNRGHPADDRSLYTDIVKGVLKALGHYDDPTAGVIANILLPDILTFDTSVASGFLNGRNLADDVIDAELKIVTNNPAASDFVDANDKAFLTKFPYYALPHPV